MNQQLLLPPGIYHYIITEKERTAFFLFQFLFLILVGYDNHWDCLIRKTLCSGKVSNITQNQEFLKEEKEEEVVEEPELVVVKKHLAEKRDAFVQLCSTAPGGLEQHPFLRVLLKSIEDSEKEVLASGSHFVTTTKTTNNNNNKQR